jgi:hypothetical protein
MCPPMCSIVPYMWCKKASHIAPLIYLIFPDAFKSTIGKFFDSNTGR